MPTRITIIQAHDFIRATFDGTLDFEESKKAVMDIASASASLPDHELLVDTRNAEVELSVTDLWYLAVEFSNVQKAFSGRTALLCPSGDFDRAAFLALCSQNRGLQVMAFASFEEAIDWLTAST
jgi:hypothetical protein